MQSILEEQNTLTAEHYSQFVHAAFIDPIRSVLIVDDDYPTVDEILLGRKEELAGKEFKPAKAWFEAPDEVQAVVQQFRGQNKPYLLDIHDAQNLSRPEELEGAKRLHQSDLLILDHELDKSKSGDGSLSLSIVRQLMVNPHYNLVVVHSNDKPEVLFPNFVLGLSQSCVPELTEKQRTILDEGLESAERDEDDVAGVDLEQELSELIGIAQYIDFVRCQMTVKKVTRKEQPYTEVASLLERFQIDERFWVIIVREFLARFEVAAKEAKQMSPVDCGNLVLSSGEKKWIRTDRAFITFVEKNHDVELLKALEEALLDWYPSPSRVFLSKLLSTLDDNGVRVQDTALKQKNALALWYKKQLEATDEELKTIIGETVRLHSEELVQVVSPEIIEFAKTLVQADRDSLNVDQPFADETKEQKKKREGDNEKKICAAVQKRYPSVDLNKPESMKRAFFEHNVTVCSQPVRGWHLQTGHIFKLGIEYWVCLSPACDTVPSQISEGQVTVIGDRLRFNAVQLHQKGQKTPSDISDGRHLFLNLSGEIEVFSFTEGEKTAPMWASLYAENRGKLGDEMTITVSRVEKTKTGELHTKSYESKIAAHLRYEYALNLIDKLSSNFTRVGLGFSG